MAASVHMAGILNPRDGWTADRCSIAAALDVVSARSAFVILREAFYGTTKFGDFATRVGLTDAVVASRLKELVDEGLLAREDYREEGQRTRQRYLLTEKGADLFPVLISLMQWGDRWTAGDGGPVEFRHRGCGAHVGAHVMCDAGHEVRSGDLELRARRTARRSKRTARS
jgi:DNA-binding HxlR family transcriptional regulator